MLPRALRRTLSWLLVVPLASAQQDPAVPAVPSEPAEAPGVDVTFLANAGFYVESERHAVLIDAFLRDPVGYYAALPEDAYRQLVNAQPPFDRPALVLVSHKHTDHVQMRALEKFLGKNERASLLTSPQVADVFREGVQATESIAQRIASVTTTRGEPRMQEHDGLRVEFLEFEHGGRGHQDVVNLGHLFELGGLRILHVGDAEPSVDTFAPFDLHARAIDVAFVPYWYFGTGPGARVLNEELRARIVVACHVPPKEWDTVSALFKTEFPAVVLFKDALEKRRFLPASAAEGGEPKEGG